MLAVLALSSKTKGSNIWNSWGKGTILKLCKLDFWLNRRL